MTSTDPWLNFLLSHIGDVEDPSGSNCCPICHAYGPIGSSTCYAWCCATQDLALEAAFGDRLLNTAGVKIARGRAQLGVNGLRWLPRADVLSGAEELRVGDLPCYDYKGNDNANDMHIEGVVNPYLTTRFETIGGNVQNRCDRWWRSLNSSVMGFIRPPFDVAGIGPVPNPHTEEEDPMDNRVYYVMHGVGAGRPEVYVVGVDPRIPPAHVVLFGTTEPVLVTRGLQVIPPPDNLQRVPGGVPDDAGTTRDVGLLDDAGAAVYGIP